MWSCYCDAVPQCNTPQSGMHHVVVLDNFLLRIVWITSSGLNSLHIDWCPKQIQNELNMMNETQTNIRFVYYKSGSSQGLLN